MIWKHPGSHLANTLQMVHVAQLPQLLVCALANISMYYFGNATRRIVLVYESLMKVYNMRRENSPKRYVSGAGQSVFLPWTTHILGVEFSSSGQRSRRDICLSMQLFWTTDCSRFTYLAVILHSRHFCRRRPQEPC
jgi:hypothetical protein